MAETYGGAQAAPEFPAKGYTIEEINAQREATGKQVNKIFADRSTEEILQERGNQYGSFHLHSQITQRLKREFIDHLKHYNPEGYKQYCANPAVREGVDMIFHKLGRAANGNILLKDTWDDTAGYAKLISKECEF